MSNPKTANFEEPGPGVVTAGDLVGLRRQATGWQPIETAPGVPVLVSRPTDRYVFIPTTAFRDATGVWRMYRSPGGNMRLPFTPTHWQPLPEPPEVIHE